MLNFVNLKFLTAKYIFLLALILIIIPTFVILPNGVLLTIKFDQFLLHPFYISKQSKILLVSFSIIAFLVMLHAKNISRFEIFSSIFYTFSSFAVILSHDLISLLIFLELMVLGAFCIIASNDLGNNKGPATRYVCIHFFAGALILAGAAAQISNTGSTELVHNTLNFQNVQLSDNIPLIMMLVGLLINCAAFPFSSWVTDSYPAASLHGTPYLSIFTTKISAYILLLLFQGSEILFYFGLITAFCAVIFAMLENNMRRLLCYNLIGQMGLIIAGVGFSGKIAAVGVILQIIFCTVYQSLLFIVVNSIIIRTEKTNLSEVGNLFKAMPAEGFYCLIGALTMAAVPGTSAFVSKSLITLDASTSNSYTLITGLFSLANFMLFMSVGLKLFYFAFIHKRKQLVVVKNNPETYIAMFILSLICILAGIFYNQYILHLLDSAPVFYQSRKVLVMVICSTILFMFSRSLFYPRLNMDMDWIYRSHFVPILLLCEKFMLSTADSGVNIIKGIVSSITELYYYSASRIKIFLDYDSFGFIVMLTVGIISILLIFLCLNHSLII